MFRLGVSIARVAALAVCVAMLTASLPSAVSATTGASAAATPPDTIAKRLVAELQRARTEGARGRALMAIARALKIGVYTPTGRAVVRGAERGSRDVYLYDFEIAYLANALGRQESFSVAELASTLTRTQRSPRGTVSEAVMARVLRDVVRTARKHPRARQSLRPLLLGELGLRQRPRYDLARSQPISRIRLNALQRFIIIADVAQGARKQVRGTASTRAAVCMFTGPAASTAGSIPVLVRQYVPGFTPAGVSTTFIHTEIATLAVRVFDDQFPSPAETHYGPKGHALFAGRALELRIRAEQLVDTHQYSVKCGILADHQLPRRGGLAGMRVHWGLLLGAGGGLTALKQHGILVRADAETGLDGVAKLVLIPKDEDLPDFGSVQTEKGTVVALVGPSTGGPMGELPLNIVPEQVTLPWEVSFHAARGFKFDTGNVRQQTPGFNEGEVYWWDSRLTARLCGEDPYQAAWAAQMTYGGWDGLYIGYDPQPYLRSGQGPTTFALSGPLTAEGVHPPDGDHDVGALTLIPGDAPKVRYEAFWFEWPSSSVEVPLEEDRSCPAQS